MNWIVRQLRWLVSFGNPLARRWDRLEAGVVLLAFLLAGGMVPVALTVGSVVHAQTVAEAAAQRAARVPATATLLAEVPATESSPAARVQTAEATWRLPTGEQRTGRITADAGTPAGAQVPVWLDPAGNVVARPMSDGDALGVAIGVAVCLWVGAAVLLALLVGVAHLGLNRRRGAEWAREWTQFSRDLKRF
ncbi:MAG TPA: hypothetical protein VHC41_00660 [Mycobacteriales bacterium]|nr:hypothetical protein [Mycobacteriales bacterium]